MLSSLEGPLVLQIKLSSGEAAWLQGPRAFRGLGVKGSGFIGFRGLGV